MESTALSLIKIKPALFYTVKRMDMIEQYIQYFIEINAVSLYEIK